MTQTKAERGPGFARRLQRTLALAGAVCLLVLLCLPLRAQAASPAINDIDITVSLNADGTAHVTEVWDVVVADGTEWYLGKYNLEQRNITGLRVQDETGLEFENVGEWNVNRTLAEKAGKCGMVAAEGGYELCWGVGSYGPHVYTVSYTMGGAVMGYDGADALYLRMVNDNLSANPQHVKVTVLRDGMEFTRENTGVWAFGFSVDFGVQDGEVVLESNRALHSSEFVALLVQFEPGLYAPAVRHDREFEDLLKDALRGSNYDLDEALAGWQAGGGENQSYAPGNENRGGVWERIKSAVGGLAAVFGPMLLFIIPLGVAAVSRKGRRGGTGQTPRQYAEVAYIREVPYKGSLAATHARLDEMRAMKSDGDLVGAYLLQWIRSRQVEIIKQPAGMLKNKEEDAIRLYAPRGDMPPVERSLYDMLVKAAGPDYVLQSKEFEKYCSKQYSKVEGWLQSHKNYGSSVMRQMGAITEETHQVFFGLIPTRRTVQTPLGNQLTAEMFGFKKYLEDFTIVNEREAREVQLWDSYLVFAQLFGIADQVAEQFRLLYPDYFRQMAADIGMNEVSWFDIYMLTRMTNAYGRAMSRGYQAGYAAAHSSMSSGGGGSYSGGGGFSAGGGGSGGGSR